jgi:asparagine synthase (glutamine-hydrolysing)
MSGICGIIRFDGSDAEIEGLDVMLRAGAHRGPDGRTSWTGEGAALGHLAFHLAASDRTESQPVHDPSGRFVIVADGRVDAREELLRTLRIRSSHLGPDPGPATLLLGAYLAWGEGFMHRVLGDWAFGVWDTLERRLFLARSPQGLRSLYYRIENDRIFFASEVRQILSVDGVPRSLFLPMAGAWLLNQSGAPEWTIYDGIRELPGGHFVDIMAGRHQVGKGWDVDPARRISYRSDEDYAEAFREILLAAVSDRLHSASPVAMLLSGGLDSSAVAGSVGWLADRGRLKVLADQVVTLSYRYDGFPQCDERHISGPLARHWGLRVEEIAASAWHPDSLLECELGEDNPAIPIYRPLEDAAMRRAGICGARQILIAARGDNMMGGSIWDPAGLVAAGRVKEGIGEIRTIARFTGGRFWSTARREFARSSKYRLRSLAPHLAARRHSDRDQRSAAVAAARTASPWMSSALIETLPSEALIGAPLYAAGFATLARARRYEAVSDAFTARGCGQTVRRAAEFGLQYEDPWADRRIVEFVCAVPQHVLNRADDRKRLTRMALAGLVPPQVQRGARKIIPAAFGEHALRTNEARSLRELTHEMVSARAGLIDEAALRAHIDDFLRGGPFQSEAWTALTLERWLRSNHVDVRW